MSIQSVSPIAVPGRLYPKLDAQRVLPPTEKMLYLCGPMSGYPDDNRAAFRDAAMHLRQAGYAVWSPAEHWDPSQGWAAAMHMDLTAVLTECDGLAILDGWWASRGAMVEIQVAGAVGYPVRPVADWIARAVHGNVHEGIVTP